MAPVSGRAFENKSKIRNFRQAALCLWCLFSRGPCKETRLKRDFRHRDGRRGREGSAGSDSGQGMPAPVDYRDMAHVWGKGFYAMDAKKLKAQLSPGTELILGDVE